MIEMINVKKEYHAYGISTPVLKGVNLKIDDGEFCSIIGRSGCGKTTLLNILGFVDSLSSGCYKFDSIDVGNISTNEAAIYRRTKIGYIFQSFNLINSMSVIENVAMPLGYAGVSKKERTDRAKALLERVGLEHRFSYPANKLSGGEQQRVAIARALIANPRVILADEPTGNLDEENSKSVMQLLSDINKEGMTVIMVSSDNTELLEVSDRIYVFYEGKVQAILSGDDRTEERLVSAMMGIGKKEDDHNA